MTQDRPSEDPEVKSSAVGDQSVADNQSASSDAWTRELNQIREQDVSKRDSSGAAPKMEKGSLEFGSSADLYLLGGNKNAEARNDSGRDAGRASNDTLDTSLRDFSKWTKSNFEKFDADKNGKIDRNEAEAQVLDPSNKGKDAVYAATLNSMLGSIEDNFKKASDGLGKEQREEVPASEFLTRDALDRFDSVVNDEKQMKDAQTEVSARQGYSKFDAVDTDNNGRVSKEELNEALKDKKWNEGGRESFNKMLEKFDDISKTANEQHIKAMKYACMPGEAPRATPELQKEADQTISKRDLSEYGKDASFAIADAKESLSKNTERLSKHLKDAKEGKNSEIHQGSVNDCFLVSPMRELTKREPDALSKLIKDNNDGTYTVKFPDSDKPYTVKAPTQAELASYTNNKDSAIVEKAYGIRFKEEHPEKKSSSISTEHLDFGSASDAITALTGSKAETVEVFGDGQDALAIAKEAQKNGEILVAGSNQWQATEGIQPQHAFAMSYNKENGKIVLENPYPVRANSSKLEPIDQYGKPMDGKLDGRFEMDAETFAMTFSHIARERRDKK